MSKIAEKNDDPLKNNLIALVSKYWSYNYSKMCDSFCCIFHNDFCQHTPIGVKD